MSENTILEKTEQSIDKSAVRDFAVNARRKLTDKVTLQANKMGFWADGRAVQYDFEDDKQFKINGETFDKKQAGILRKQINEKGFDAVIDEAAYTWFNRFVALYYMECHNYIENGLNVISSIDDLNTVAMKAPDYLKTLNKDVLFNAIQNNNSDDIYKTLIISQCNELSDKLSFLFEKISDYTELLFPQGMLNNDSVIREMLTLDKANWQEVEIIGWLYQYYISELKETIDYELKNKKNRKVQKEDMPAKTQIFTPKWIVSYMVENSVGKLWLEAHPDERLQSLFKYYLESAEQEDEVKEELAKIVDKNLRPENIKVLDPACGSGHILVTAFSTLFEIYKSSGYLEDEIPQLILTQNLYGLDICDRAAQLSQLAVLMKAREYDRNIFNKHIELNITSIQDTNWMDTRVKEALMNGVENNLLAQQQITNLVDTFQDAKEYGSILEVKDFDFDFWNERLIAIQSLNLGLLYSDVVRYLQERLPQLIKQAKIMQQKYESVITNPPYLGSKYFNGKLGEFINKKYPNSKSDMCVAFIEKAISMTKPNNYFSLVVMQSWMFLSSFEQFREQLLNNATISTMTHMGNNVMRIAFGTCATIWKRTLLPKYKATYSWIENDDITDQDIPREFPIKDNGRYNVVAQNGFHSIPGSPIAYWASDRVREIFKTSKKTSDYADVITGMTIGDNNLYMRFWSEVNYPKINIEEVEYNNIDLKEKNWIPYLKGGGYRKWYGLYEYIVNWSQSSNFNRPKTTMKDKYLEKGITWSFLTSYAFSARFFNYGFLWDVAGSPMFLKDINKLEYILGLLGTKITRYFLNLVNPTLNFQAIEVAAMPLIFDDNKKDFIKNLVNNNILISKDDWDSFETSWDFEQHPLLRFRSPCHPELVSGSNQPEMLKQVQHDNSFAQHSNYKLQDCFNNWKTYKEQQFNQLKANEEELNRLFIEIYGLQDEMTPEVADKDITVAKADELRDIKSLLSYAVGCMFGRYSLDEKGLVFAGGEFDLSKYKTLEVDEDGILPILSDSWFDDDIIEEFKLFIKKAFGELYLSENLQYIASVLNNKSSESPEKVIRNYFLKDFYKDHIQTYKKRPIYWMFTSGKEKAFNCLIYLHRYNKTSLSRIRKDYLHEYQAKLDRAIAQAESEGNVKLNSLYAKYQQEILEFDRKLQVLADSQIELDLDDGVQSNYAKFKGLMEAEKDIIKKEK